MFTFSKSPQIPIPSIYTTYQKRPISPPQYYARSPTNFPIPTQIIDAYNPITLTKPSFESPIKFNSVSVPYHNHRLIAAVPKSPSNLYYNTGIHRNYSSDSNRSNSGSYGDHRYPGKQFEAYLNGQKARYPVRRIMSPMPGSNYLSNNSRGHHKSIKINIRYSSPPPVEASIKKPQLLNSKSSVFTFGEPKKPQILKVKKPGVRRMNSLTHSDQQSPNYHIHVHYDPEVKGLEQKNINQRNQTYSKHKTESNQNTSDTQANIPNYSISHEIVSMTPKKKQQEGSGIKMAKIDEHNYDQEHQVASLLTGQLQLNYDYLRDVENSDRSISDYVAL